MTTHAKIPIKLPPCGVFVGRGIRNSAPDRLVCSGRVDAGAERHFINSSHSPQDGTICLQNLEFSSPHRLFLCRREQTIPMELAPGEFRLFDAVATPLSSPQTRKTNMLQP